MSGVYRTNGTSNPITQYGLQKASDASSTKQPGWDWLVYADIDSIVPDAPYRVGIRAKCQPSGLSPDLRMKSEPIAAANFDAAKNLASAAARKSKNYDGSSAYQAQAVARDSDGQFWVVPLSYNYRGVDRPLSIDRPATPSGASDTRIGLHQIHPDLVAIVGVDSIIFADNGEVQPLKK